MQRIPLTSKAQPKVSPTQEGLDTVATEMFRESDHRNKEVVDREEIMLVTNPEDLNSGKIPWSELCGIPKASAKDTTDIKDATYVGPGDGLDTVATEMFREMTDARRSLIDEEVMLVTNPEDLNSGKNHAILWLSDSKGSEPKSTTVDVLGRKRAIPLRLRKQQAVDGEHAPKASSVDEEWPGAVLCGRNFFAVGATSCRLGRAGPFSPSPSLAAARQLIAALQQHSLPRPARILRPVLLFSGRI
jgi:hypothetical protein